MWVRERPRGRDYLRQPLGVSGVVGGQAVEHEQQPVYAVRVAAVLEQVHGLLAGVG